MRETGRPFIHPYDHLDICAGQGTVGLEILEQYPDVRTVVVCTGGGGLLAGIATAIKGVAPRRQGDWGAGVRRRGLPRLTGCAPSRAA